MPHIKVKQLKCRWLKLHYNLTQNELSEVFFSKLSATKRDFKFSTVSCSVLVFKYFTVDIFFMLNPK